MPLVQVDMPRALFEAHVGKMSVELRQAFIEALEVPASDKFQIFRGRRDRLRPRPQWRGLARRGLPSAQRADAAAAAG
jgi:hypothetical protein